MSNLSEFKLSLYKTLTKLSENKKSEVFLVQHTQTNNIYVKKILTKYNIEVYKAIQGFQNIHTPYIYEIFEFENKLIIIEEFINGLTLEEILKSCEYLNEVKTIEYMLSLCDILENLHNLKPAIIHRDIKPSNIMITNDGILKLIDYDISRTYKMDEGCDTVIMGTQEYASPEQFGFSQTDCRSDIYSLGILMNVLTIGKYPKYEKNKGILKDVIEKCIKISPEYRYQSIKELELELQLKLRHPKKEFKVDKKKNLIRSNKWITIYKNTCSKKIATYKHKFKLYNENYKYRPDKITLRNFYKTIPGFRSEKIWKSIIACIWYLFLILMLVISTTSSLLEDIIMISALIVLTILYTNFLNIKNNIPLLKNDKILVRILAYVIYTVIIILIEGTLSGNLKK